MGIIETLNHWDTELFLYLNSFHNSFWDYTMTLFTRTEMWLLFYLVIFITIIRKYNRKSILIFLVIALLIVFADQGSGILKHSIQRLRPSHDPYVAPLAHNFFKKGGWYGFVSAHASYSDGEVITKPIIFEGSRLTVNFSTSASGLLKVEIENADGESIQGYELSNCSDIYGDQIEREIKWKTGDVKRLSSKPIRLRFILRDADLFAFGFKDKL